MAGHQGLIERATTQKSVRKGPAKLEPIQDNRSIEWARAEPSRKGSAKSQPTLSLKSFELTDRLSGLVQRLLEKGRLSLNLQGSSITLSLQVD